MIDLLARDAASGYGIAALLETEKIPYRTVTSIGDAATPLIVAARDLAPDEIATLADRRALVLHGGARFARDVLGAADAVDVERAATVLVGTPAQDSAAPAAQRDDAATVDGTPWSAATVTLARALGKATLRLPPVPLCATSTLAHAAILATFADGTPAIAARGGCLWSAVDLGAAFTALVTERAAPTHHTTPALAPLRTAARRLAEHVYYAAPEALRRRVQRRWYAALERRLEALGDAASEYPIDPTGWLLAELVTSLVRRLDGGLARVSRWPAPYTAAATLTHDVEPRRFAYTRGLAALLDAVATSGHAATFGLVARPSARWLDTATVARLGRHAVLCHGLEHRGENVCGDEVRRDVETARRDLERRLARPVRGYRSPRLDRSPDLLCALDEVGFAYDSSYPDVDRENIAHFGGGVRVNVPYRPPLASDGGGLRPSRCLELPLTAPDCIQPLFAGAAVETLHADVAAKAAFVRATGGLYVALVHGGVFDREDEERRTAHLEFVAGELRHPDVWLASAEQVADWWCRRESLRVTDDGTSVRVVNHGKQPIEGVRVVLERDGDERTIDVPPLAPGVSFTITATDSKHHLAAESAVAPAPNRVVPAA
jgi:peptidoglycan/xylan/chitin deacetylase (PgdA/CDA1 family)